MSRDPRPLPVPLSVIALRDSRPYPEGWFRLADAASVKPGATRVLRASGRDVVLFRTRSGEFGAVDAFCPHLGAHMGHGGTVQDESLRCPFHGLRFAPDGRCVGHASREKLRVAAWPVQEWEGQVMIYLSGDGREPAWQLPRLERALFSPLRWREIELEGHVQDIAENGVDVRHFEALHRYLDVGEPEIRFDGHRIFSKFAFRRSSPVPLLATVRSVFDTEIHGLGCSITNLTVEELRVRAQLLIMPRQLEPKRVCFALGMRIRLGADLERFDRVLGSAGSALFTNFLLTHVMRDALQDQAIWQHRVPLPRPALLPGDGPIGQFRRYARQFYPGETSD